MDEYYLSEIRLFAGNYEPRNWMICDGRTLPINQNMALFSLIGTMYGGDGRTTFKLPDLRGRIPVGTGQGPGLTRRQIGETGGRETVQLTTAQIPAHTHTLRAGDAASSPAPTDLAFANAGAVNAYRATQDTPITLADDVLTEAGNSQPHDNVQPCLALNYIICVYGIYPSRY